VGVPPVAALVTTRLPRRWPPGNPPCAIQRISGNITLYHPIREKKHGGGRRRSRAENGTPRLPRLELGRWCFSGIWRLGFGASTQGPALQPLPADYSVIFRYIPINSAIHAKGMGGRRRARPGRAPLEIGFLPNEPIPAIIVQPAGNPENHASPIAYPEIASNCKSTTCKGFFR
jgi:hypothetical protein